MFYSTCSFCCSPDGYLYDKEAILEYIIHQKKEIARKLKEYERQKQSQEVIKTLVYFKHYYLKILNVIKFPDHLITILNKWFHVERKSESVNR